MPPRIRRPLRDAKGCEHCNHTGYLGQIALFEHWENNEAMRDLLVRNADMSEMVDATRKADFETLGEYGFRLAAIGLTSIREVEEAVFGLSFDQAPDSEKSKDSEKAAS